MPYKTPVFVIWVGDHTVNIEYYLQTDPFLIHHRTMVNNVEENCNALAAAENNAYDSYLLKQIELCIKVVKIECRREHD